MKDLYLFAFLGLVLPIGMTSTAAAQSRASHPALKQIIDARHMLAASEVRIAPTTMQTGSTSIDIGSDHWSARGYDVKSLLSEIYNIDVRRIDLAHDGADITRYDLTLDNAPEMDTSAMQRLLVSALEKKFGVKITSELRAVEVYVMSAPTGPGSQLHRHGGNSADDDAGQITSMGRDCPGISSHGVEVLATTISDFGQVLEMDMDRAVVDETNLIGRYDFKLDGYASQADLLQQLRDRLGLVVLPLERKLMVLKVRPQVQIASLQEAFLAN